MSEKRTNIEVIAPTTEEAIAKGLEDLGLPEEAVEVEVLDPGSRGLFGLGSRQARVRLTIKTVRDESRAPVQPAAQAAVQPVQPPIQTAPTPAPSSAAPASNGVAAQKPARPAPAAIEEAEASGEFGEEDDESALRVARETVSELLEKMKVHAQVTAHFGEPDDARSKSPLIVDVNGDDLSILIGPRAETLNALQYIAGLIVSKELGRAVPLMVDVEGFRMRREQQIRQLARRMADQAVKTGRRQVLEPMPANERRLVHIELRSNPAVTTESVGEEPRRKVTIVPK